MAELSGGYYQNYLVHGLPHEAIDLIAGLAKEERYGMNDLILRQGERGSDLYIVLEGQVNIIVGGGDKLNEVGPGSVFGEISLIDDQPRSADAVAKSEVRVAKFDASELRDFMWHHRDIGFVLLANLSKVLCARLRQASETIDQLMDDKSDPWVGEN